MTDPLRYPTFVAFLNGACIARGPLPVVARAAKIATDSGASRAVQIFDAETSEPWDLDLSGTLEDVDRRHLLDDTPRPHGSGAARGGPGRPRLGVVAREVTLLPRHWAWLAEQPGGASAALRRLVDHARVSNAERDVIRRSQERAYRFMSYAAGDAPGFEEAARALFARDRTAFLSHIAEWPSDVRTHALALAAAAWEG